MSIHCASPFLFLQIFLAQNYHKMHFHKHKYQHRFNNNSNLPATQPDRPNSKSCTHISYARPIPTRSHPLHATFRVYVNIFWHRLPPKQYTFSFSSTVLTRIYKDTNPPPALKAAWPQINANWHSHATHAGARVATIERSQQDSHKSPIVTLLPWFSSSFVFVRVWIFEYTACSLWVFESQSIW